MNGNQLSDGATDSGAVYVFARVGGLWSQRSYVKGPNTDASDQIFRIDLSMNGEVLVVAAAGEDGSGTGIGANQTSNSAGSSGAVYLY